MNTNPGKTTKATEVPRDVPSASDKSAGAPATPRWWRDDKHGAAWESSKQSVSSSWGQSRTAQIDPMNRDQAQGQRIPSGKPVSTEGAGQPKAGLDPSDIAEARTQTPAPKLNPSYGATQASDAQFAKGARELKPDDLRLGGDEEALRYGIGAREEFGAAHPTWNSELEQKLQADWMDAFDATKRPRRDWSQVQQQVRHAYEHRGDKDQKSRA